jgi:O-glycosyl hydrolase
MRGDLSGSDVLASVDFATKLQQWDGFGVNYVQAARTPNYHEQSQDYGGFSFLTEAQRQEIIALIFGEDGLQPALVKLFLDPLHQDKPGGVFDHETSTHWMRAFVREGLELTRRRGDDLRILTALYGPPAWATRQRQLNSRDLDPAQYIALSDYLIDWVRWLREEEGLPVEAVSLHNEGDKPHNWPIDGRVSAAEIFDYNAFWSPAEIAEFIPILRDRLDARGLQPIAITPGECSSWLNFHERLYDWAIAANPDALRDLGLITCHSFGGHGNITSAGVRYLRRFRPDLHAWVSSASWGNFDMHLAQHIAANINQVRVNGYIPWSILQTPAEWKDGMDPNAAPPIRVSKAGSYEVLSTYHLYKQFTRAGRPGMAVAPTAVSADTGIEVVAFGNNETAHPDAFILMNFNSWQSRTVAVRVSGTKVDSFGAYRTWRRYGQVTMETYRDLGVVSIEDGYIVCDVPPHSVTSFLGKVQ